MLSLHFKALKWYHCKKKIVYRVKEKAAAKYNNPL